MSYQAGLLVSQCSHSQAGGMLGNEMWCSQVQVLQGGPHILLQLVLSASLLEPMGLLPTPPHQLGLNEPKSVFCLTQICQAFSCLHLLLGSRELPFCALPWNGSLSPKGFSGVRV